MSRSVIRMERRRSEVVRSGSLGASDRNVNHRTRTWIGNSATWAEKHYERAIESRSALPYRAPSLPATPRMRPHTVPADAKTRRNSHAARTELQKVGDEGLERSPFSSGKKPFRKERRTHSGTVQDDSDQIPPGLAMVVNAWPSLSETAQKEILQVVRREASAEAVD